LLCKEFEQYSILVDHLRYKKILFSWKSGSGEYSRLNKEIEYYDKCNRLSYESEHYYYQLGLLQEYSSKRNGEKLQKDLKSRIAILENSYFETRSSIIKYHKTFLELGYYQHFENHLKSRSVCLELLNVVRKNKPVYRRQRIGIVHDNLSRCEYYLGNYAQAAEWAREGQKHFNTGSENYSIALEQEFYALFAMEQYEQAVDIANKMINGAPPKELGEFRHAKYNYLLANALFKQRRFTEALHILSQELELSKDKAGWETGLRTLKIMTLIEMLKLDEASLAVSSLKQFFKYNDKKGTTISVRDKKILNLLLVAERAGFLFSTLNGNTDKYMEPLCSDEKEYKWEPFTHEVIPFHSWFAGKMPQHHFKKPAKKAAKAEKREKVLVLK
jgi:tetratricopeptide (TPR) repeat protein